MAFEVPFAWHPCQGAADRRALSGGLRFARPPAIGLQPFQVAGSQPGAGGPAVHNLWNSPHEILRAARKYELFALRIRADAQIDPRRVYPRVSAKSAVLHSIHRPKNLRRTQRNKLLEVQGGQRWRP